MNIPRPLPVLLLLTACFLGGSGCGGKEKVVTVTGTVTHKGDPVAGMVVSFVPEAQTVSGVSTATTDENGHYKLTVFKTGQSGAVVGTHKVWVSLPREPPPDLDKDKVNKKPVPTTKPPVDTAEILKKYGKLDSTPLTVEVKGEPIDLKLD
jgi:hypothetical protein